VKPLTSYENVHETSERKWSPTPSLGSGAWVNRRLSTPRILRLVKRTATPPIDGLLREVERSREILEWPDDWDDEGSPAYEEETWKKATDFLLRQARMLSQRGIQLPAPRILPGPGGSIDLHWETGAHELLVNVPVTDLLAGFYGEVMGASSVKGKLDLESPSTGLFAWLMTTD
jgi:hypothetical protein